MQSTFSNYDNFAGRTNDFLAVSGALSFTTEVLDEGGGWNTDTYTGPKDGVYLISVSFTCDGSATSVIKVKVNGVEKINVCCDNTNRVLPHTTGSFQMLNLIAGDQLTIEPMTGINSTNFSCSFP